MKTTGRRSVVLYILLVGFLAGMTYLVINILINGARFAMQPYNGHLYAQNSTVSLGKIIDRNGVVLATSENSVREYAENEDTRRALLHTVGDTAGYISTGVQSAMRGRLTGYNFITGINDVFFNRLSSNIELTIDAGISTQAYYAMGDRNGAVMVYNYKTGEVICKVSKPSFDPANVPEDIEDNPYYEGVYLDRNLSSAFTPGSIFKIVTAAAAIEKWPNNWSSRRYTCEGKIEIGNGDITCMGYHGEIDMYTAMGESCNVYFALLANDIGSSLLQEKAEQLGFNRSFSFGNVRCVQSTIDLSTANNNELGWAGVGQYTVLANPYHMMVMMGAAANGGTFVEPKISNSSSLLSSVMSTGEKRLMSITEASGLESLLRNDVEYYYGDYLFPAGMDVCAKTGTGEVGNGKGPNCWMIGYSRNESTPYAFVVLIEDGYGGIESAGNVASAVMNAIS